MVRNGLAGLANCSFTQVKTAIDNWVPKWYNIAKAYTRMTWLGKFPEVYEELRPTGSRNNFDFKFVNLDGKVFPCEQSRVSGLIGRAMYSNKVKKAGLQTLVWSAPCGLPLLVTGLFGGKLSEKQHVRIHKGWLLAFPKGVRIMADRGFRRLQRWYKHHNIHMIPAACNWVSVSISFLKGEFETYTTILFVYQ